MCRVQRVGLGAETLGFGDITPITDNQIEGHFKVKCWVYYE